MMIEYGSFLVKTRKLQHLSRILTGKIVTKVAAQGGGCRDDRCMQTIAYFPGEATHFRFVTR